MNTLKLLISFIFIINFSFAQKITLDNFENLSDWKTITSDGVTLKTTISKGAYKGNAIRLNFSFNTGAGYCGIRKALEIEMPENYEFSFYIRGEMQNNNLEFKLIDQTGENVWWLNQRNYEFQFEWKKITIKKRHINFAWGPIGGGEMKKLSNLEIFIAAGNGGNGYFEISDLTFEPLKKESDNSYSAKILTSGNIDNKPIKLENNILSGEWESKGIKDEWLLFDFGEKREFGGMILDWDSLKFASKFDIICSEDSMRWEKVYSSENGHGNRNYIYLPEITSRYLKIVLTEGSNKNFRLKNIRIEGIKYSSTINDFFQNIAKDFPRGYFPKYLIGEQSYWTITGVNSDIKEALINEDGMIETDKASFSIEPFLYCNNKLITWNDVERKQSLEENYLPIPKVIWDHKDISLSTKIFTSGEKGKSSIYAIYEIENISGADLSGSLFLALRPFQVNPTSQWLNTLGGFAKTTSIENKNDYILINNSKKVIPIMNPDNVGFTNLDGGDIITYLEKGKVPDNKIIQDKNGFCSGALEYKFNLKPNEKKSYSLIVPFYENSDYSQNNTAKSIEDLQKANCELWKNKINNVEISFPDKYSKISNTLKSYLAYILINRDENAIQPGSRSYERAWIRDGSLTSSCLLRMGITKEVKEYLDWYSKYIFENGKVPCVVDKRGPDPVPENDSHGEYIFVILQYYQFTKDLDFLKEKFSSIKKVVEYIDFLISQRKTDKYKNEDEYKVFYGLVPESISHEGYSSKPMHSYWDDFFTMKGLKDAVTIAEILGEKDIAKKIINIRDDFKVNLYNSLKLAMKNKKIDYIPGCAELGDFDATSTAIALYPCGEIQNLPTKELNNTFDKYYDYFTKRWKNEIEWDAYTPYEVRIIGALNLLNRKEQSHKLMEFFFSDQRPKEWNHWVEVVWKDPKTLKFIGDMPHTWVGSDYINSIRNMLVYEREADNSLIIGMGIKKEWVTEQNGITIKNLPTYYGKINYTMKGNEKEVKMELSGNIEKIKGKIIIKSPIDIDIKEVYIDNKKTKSFSKDEVYLSKCKGKVLIKY